MKKIFCVTGTPGSGKTTFAKKLARQHHFHYVDFNQLLKQNKLYDSYDRSLRTYEYNEKAIKKALAPLIRDAIRNKTGLVVDSHRSHYALPRSVDLCYVVTCDPSVLKRRLQRRHYSKRKIRENLDAEILSICLIEAIENGHKICTIRGF